MNRNDANKKPSDLLLEVTSQLERHDSHYHCRHTPESTRARTELVRTIQALQHEVSAPPRGSERAIQRVGATRAG
jgi:hypothetical protein